MREAEFQAQVVKFARMSGCLVYHTHDSRRSEPGFPDLVIVGGRSILYRELKTATGVTSPEQEQWIFLLNAAGGDADIWRPADWPVRIAQEIHAIGRAPRKPSEISQDELRKIVRSRGASDTRKDSFRP